VNAGLLPALILAAAASPTAEGETQPAPSEGLVVETAGQCPARDAVMAALLPVLGEEAIRSTPGVSRVSDLGDRFEVTVLGQTRQYPDPARDCVERARVAAVFIALAVRPPVFAPPPTPPPPPPVIKTEAPPPPAAPAPAAWRSAAVGARFDSGSGDRSPSLAAGAELRAGLGLHAFGVVATAGILAPTERRLSSVAVHEQRFPCSVAFIVRRQLTGVEVAGALGVALVPFTLHADGLATSDPATRFDTGGRAALEIRLPLFDRRLAPFVDVHAEYFPRTYAIDVDPLGNVGSTGKFWVGATVGASLDGYR